MVVGDSELRSVIFVRACNNIYPFSQKNSKNRNKWSFETYFQNIHFVSIFLKFSSIFHKNISRTCEKICFLLYFPLLFSSLLFFNKKFERTVQVIRLNHYCFSLKNSIHLLTCYLQTVWACDLHNFMKHQLPNRFFLKD